MTADSVALRSDCLDVQVDLELHSLHLAFFLVVGKKTTYFSIMLSNNLIKYTEIGAYLYN